MDLKQILREIHVPGAEWIGLREVVESVTQRTARDGKPTANFTNTSQGIMVEVLANGLFAYAALPTRNPKELENAALLALEQAKNAAKYSVYRFTPEQRINSTGNYSYTKDSEFSKKSAADINDFLIKSCGTLRVSPKIIRSVAMLLLAESKHRFVSSSGADITQDFEFLSTNFSATALEGNIIQNRTDGGLMARSQQKGWASLEAPDFWDRIRIVGEQAVELLSAEECPTTTTSVVLMPDQMMLQIHESIGHPLEIDRILGDERNYAGSSFVKLSDFGTLTYGSPLMNITFDPTISGEFASYSFDDNGTPASREFLIKEGKLLRGLGGVESQARSGVKGVANARACLWNRPPIDRMANINLEPGQSTLDEIISSVEDGVLMESNRSWSIDDYRRKFQFGCEYGKWIKNGKISKTVRNPNYRGITVPFWKGLKMVGNSGTIGICGTPYCGKGEPNQAIRVGHSSPACLFENVEVFGGAQ